MPQWVVADRGFSSHAFREHIWNVGARPAIPSKKNEAPVACPDWDHLAVAAFDDAAMSDAHSL